jgi:chaperone modulatory protein CbpM
MRKDIVRVVRGTVLDEEEQLTLDQLCTLCRVPEGAITEMVEEGILEPDGERPVDWRFAGICVQHVRVVVRLQRDLGVNLAGAAVVLELLDRLRSR